MRRPMKSQPTSIFEDPVCIYGKGHSGEGWYAYEAEYGDEGTEFLNCPYSPGEVVYMQEEWCPYAEEELTGRIFYRAADERTHDIWKENSKRPHLYSWCSPVTMPFDASRLHLRLTVRPERLWEITEEEVAKGGVKVPKCPYCGYSLWDCQLQLDHNLCPHSTPKSGIPSFATLWDSIYGKKYPWSSNPWIWRYGMEEVWRR